MPDASAKLYAAISPYVDHLLVDPLNYRSQVKDIFFRNRWDYELSDQYAAKTRGTLMGLWESRADDPPDASLT